MSRPSWLPEPAWTPGILEYHAEPSWSSSSIREFMRSPAKAQLIRTGGLPWKSTTATRTGSIFHTLCLEGPNAFEGQYQVVECKASTAKVFTEAEEAEAEKPLAKRKEVVTFEELQTAKKMVEAIRNPRTRSARLANKLLSGGVAEYSHRWEDPETGVGMRCRWDYTKEEKRQKVTVSLKSASSPDPESFYWSVKKYRYDIQEAIYDHGFFDLVGSAPVSYWVVVGSSEPWEVGVYPVEIPWIVEGAASLREALNDIADAELLPKGQRWTASFENGLTSLRQYSRDNY